MRRNAIPSLAVFVLTLLLACAAGAALAQPVPAGPDDYPWTGQVRQGEGESTEGEESAEGEAEGEGEGEGEASGESESEGEDSAEGEAEGEGEANGEGESEGEGGEEGEPVSGGFLAYESSDVPLGILDQSEVASSLNVPDSLTISAVNVALDIYHDRLSDLSVWIESPVGTRVQLFARLNTDAAEMNLTNFTDVASRAISEGTPPFSGNFQPEEELATFAGENMQGEWELVIRDVVSGSEGVLEEWRIAFNDATVDNDTETEDAGGILGFLTILLSIFVPLGVLEIVSLGGDGPCFIATAAFGTPLAGGVEVLRVFRDTWLLSNPAGTAFVDVYYHVSPPLASWLVQYPALALAVRVLLMPVIALAWGLTYYPAPTLLVIAMTAYAWRKRRMARKQARP